MDNNHLQNSNMEQQNNQYMNQQPTDQSFMNQQPMAQQFQQGYPYMGQQPMDQPYMGQQPMDQPYMGQQPMDQPYMGQQPMDQPFVGEQPMQQDPNVGQYTYTIPWMNGTGTAGNTTAYTPVPQSPQYNAGQAYMPNQSYAPMPGQRQTSEGMGIAIAGMVFGIFSILLCVCNILDLVLVLPGIILSSIALAGQKPGKGMAIAGLVCSVIGFLLSGFIFIAAFMA